MGDEKYIKGGGAVVGSGRVRGFRNKYDQRLVGGRQHVNNLQLGDIPPHLMRVGSRVGEGALLERRRKDVDYDAPVSFAQAKVQSPDLESYSLDYQAIPPLAAPTNVAAGVVNFPLLSITITPGIRAIIKRFGWYTNAAGLANLRFGLYIGDELMLPGGKFIGDQPRTLNEFNPSGASIAFEDLAECHVPVAPDNVVRILVTNGDAANAHSAWGRLWGWHWEDQMREDGRRAYYNEQLDKLA